jgi:hypothetical protein
MERDYRMRFTPLSVHFKDLEIPSEVYYSTLLLDEEQLNDTNLESYDKLIVVSETQRQSTFDLSGYRYTCHVATPTFRVSLFEKDTLQQDVTFVIQGLVHEHTPFTLIYTAPYGAVSLGLWDSDLDLVKEIQVKQNIDNYYNKYFQSVSTLKGLLNVKTEYAIKVRSDEYYINFLPFITKMKSQGAQKILTSNIYFHKANDWPYHISDHIMGGKKECLIRMFYYARVNAETRALNGITPEVHLAISYLLQFSSVHPEDRDLQKILVLMYTFFDLFPIRLFENYKVKGTRFLTKADGPVPGINTLETMSDFAVQLS